MSKLHFSAAALAPVLADIQKNAGELWLVRDEGIYLMAQNASLNASGKRDLAYAQGFDPHEPVEEGEDEDDWFLKMEDVFAGGDASYVLEFSPQLMDFLTKKPADLCILVEDEGFKFMAKRVRS